MDQNVTSNGLNNLKHRVKRHWENEVCGSKYGTSTERRRDYFDNIEKIRYQLEPYIPEFAGFGKAKSKRVLEIGVGAGSDYHNWLRNGAMATGIDFSESAINLTRERLQINRIDEDAYQLLVADAENVPFDNNIFDIIYSYGVLHHTPNTALAFAEAFRLLRPGGTLKAMIYHVPSITGWLLWIQHSLLRGKPFQPPKDAIFNNLESPGTKAYTLLEAGQLLVKTGFKNLELETKLGSGDLLTIKPSKKYQSSFFKLIWKIYPRWLVRLMGDRFGLFLMIRAIKPAEEKRPVKDKVIDCSIC